MRRCRRALLDRAPAIVRRRGIDLRPLDVADDEDVRLLECFVWADSEERMARLRQALAIAADDPPEIVAGDYVELLPSLLADRDPERATVVFQTVSTIYLEEERYAELRRIVDAADPPVAWISTRRWSEEETGLEGGFELEARRAGDRAARLVARMGFHGQWLDAGRVITSASNPRIRLVRRLASRRQRERLGLFVCEGEDLVAAGLDAGVEPVHALVDAERPPADLVDRLPETDEVAPALLREISSLGHHARVLAVFRRDDLPREAVRRRPGALARRGSRQRRHAPARRRRVRRRLRRALRGVRRPDGAEGAARRRRRDLPRAGRRLRRRAPTMDGARDARRPGAPGRWRCRPRARSCSARSARACPTTSPRPATRSRRSRRPARPSR